MNRVIIQDRAAVSVKKGHPWIFSGKISSITPDDKTPLAEVYSKKGDFLCLGYYNPSTSIAIRVLSLARTEIGRDFFKVRIDNSLRRRFRSGIDNQSDSYRVVNGESDLLPGLIIDRYGKTAVIQIHTLGMDFFRDHIVDAMLEVLSPNSIYEKSENLSIKREGLARKKGLLAGNKIDENIIIHENGLSFEVDIIRGQKTGFFLDQRDNRSLIRKISKGLRVLNLFSYTCASGVNAMAGGADYVLNVDISESAILTGRHNFCINGLGEDSAGFIAGDVFEYLKSENHRFDMVIVDPPAFIKSIKDRRKGMEAYSRINGLALEKLEKGGIFLTSSCSSLLKRIEFENLITGLLTERGLHMQYGGIYGHPADHPVLASFPEGNYLKTFHFTGL